MRLALVGVTLQRAKRTFDKKEWLLNCAATRERAGRSSDAHRSNFTAICDAPPPRIDIRLVRRLNEQRVPNEIIEVGAGVTTDMTW